MARHAAIDWIPDSVEESDRTSWIPSPFPGRQRPLCAYPGTAKYNGKGGSGGTAAKCAGTLA